MADFLIVGADKAVKRAQAISKPAACHFLLCVYMSDSVSLHLNFPLSLCTENIISPFFKDNFIFACIQLPPLFLLFLSFYFLFEEKTVKEILLKQLFSCYVQTMSY